MVISMSNPDPRVVKVAHYNNHPSGIEAIEICRYMSFNMGNCMKYLFRLQEKEGPYLNSQKCRWYVLDEEKERQPLSRMKNPEGCVIVRKSMRSVLAGEPDALVAQCMRYVYLADMTHDGYFFGKAHDHLNELVSRYAPPY